MNKITLIFTLQKNVLPAITTNRASARHTRNCTTSLKVQTKAVHIRFHKS